MIQVMCNLCCVVSAFSVSGMTSVSAFYDLVNSAVVTVSFVASLIFVIP